MNGPDLALLLASDLVRDSDESYPLDRIRMQKAAFLVSERGNDKLRAFEFEPYNWGPYSSDLNSSLRHLTALDLLDTERKPGHQYPEYTTTPAGESRAEVLWGTLEDREKAFLKVVRKFVTSRSFSQLLRDVYAAYPDYATRSQFSG